MSLGVFTIIKFGIEMKLFPSNPAEGIPSYLAKVRSPEKRLRMRHHAGGKAISINGFYPTASAYDSSSSIGEDRGTYFEQVSGTTIGNDAGSRLVVFEEVPPFADSLYILKHRVLDNTDIRVFAGWSTELMW